MNLEKRLEQLEARAGTADDFLLMILSFVDCDPETIGPERAIEYPVAGYSAVGGDRRWEPSPRESLSDLRNRMADELRGDGHSAYVVCECVGDVATAQQLPCFTKKSSRSASASHSNDS